MNYVSIVRLFNHILTRRRWICNAGFVLSQVDGIGTGHAIGCRRSELQCILGEGAATSLTYVQCFEKEASGGLAVVHSNNTRSLV